MVDCSCLWCVGRIEEAAGPILLTAYRLDNLASQILQQHRAPLQYADFEAHK